MFSATQIYSKELWALCIMVVLFNRSPLSVHLCVQHYFVELHIATVEIHNSQTSTSRERRINTTLHPTPEVLRVKHSPLTYFGPSFYLSLTLSRRQQPSTIQESKVAEAVH